MRTLICGSIAYDTIMVFAGHFKDQILPDQVHILNVAFLVPEMRREFGGCAGNIAYNLKLLGGDAVPMATVGDDAAPYFTRLDKVGLDARCIRHVEGSYTAQAFITTDLADNQITAFHPGAMNFSEQNHVADAHLPNRPIQLGIVAPDGRAGMIQHAREFAEAGIPFVFDPGQGLPMFDGADLLAFIEQATYLTVNDYEAKLLCDRTGRSPEQLARSLKALIITRGGEGSLIYADNKVIEIPCVRASGLADPTGCGDAYRGGLLYGIAQGMDWATTGRLASTMGAIKIACKGPQNHEPSRTEIAEVFRSAFGTAPW